MNRILFALTQTYDAKIFDPSDRARIAAAGQIIPSPLADVIDAAYLKAHVGQADIIITSWETAALDAQVMANAGQLKLLAHAAGSVKPVVSDALWEADVRVTSSAAAISYGVAEYCLGLILMATKRAFWAGLATRQGQWTEGYRAFHGPHEIYKQNIGVIGASHVGRKLIALLQQFDTHVFLYDPYCTAEQAHALGAVKVDSLDALFSTCSVISLNAPNTPQTQNMIRGEHFQKLKPGSLFVNTARGDIVCEQEMIDELRKGTFVACLDVTQTEPPLLDSPLRQLPNVWLTPHEAGVVNQNMLRLGTLVADEIEAFVRGDALTHEVKQDQLARIG